MNPYYELAGDELSIEELDMKFHLMELIEIMPEPSGNKKYDKLMRNILDGMMERFYSTFWGYADAE